MRIVKSFSCDSCCPFMLLFQEEQTEEESGTVFFDPGSPFFSLTLQVGGGALGGLLLCGCVLEACQRSRKNMKQAGKFHFAHGKGGLMTCFTKMRRTIQVTVSVTSFTSNCKWL